MTNKLISELANIDFYPSYMPIEEGNQITLGDLHGNALKLLHSLVKHAVVECSEAQYYRFVEIYSKKTSTLTDRDLSEIKKICDDLSIKNKVKICLIGDEMADRGQNDYFTLLLLNKLKNESISIDILLSNHGFSFIECLETDSPFRSDQLWGDRRFGRSMHQLQDLIDDNKLEEEAIKALARYCYLPNLKLLSYTIASSKEITYYSHAKIDEEVILNLARIMEVPFYTNTVFQFAETIDAINESFKKKYVQTQLVYTLPQSFEQVCKNDPITFLMWNRDYDILRNNAHSFTINEVHGHDSNGTITDSVYCLNNTLGKDLSAHTGEYSVLVSSLKFQSKNPEKDTTEKNVLETSIRPEENSLVNNFFSDLLINNEIFENNNFLFSQSNTISFFVNQSAFSDPINSEEASATIELMVSS